MESAGSAVVDFGRFCTGFLVVMGVGTLSPSTKLAKFWAVRTRVMKDLC